MAAVLINLPESIKKDSTKVAKRLGVSRTEFIKQAIIHELDNFKRKTEEAKIARVFQSMRKSKSYLSDSPYAKTLFARKFVSSFIDAIFAATNNLYLMAK